MDQCQERNEWNMNFHSLIEGAGEDSKHAFTFFKKGLETGTINGHPALQFGSLYLNRAINLSENDYNDLVVVTCLLTHELAYPSATTWGADTLWAAESMNLSKRQRQIFLGLNAADAGGDSTDSLLTLCQLVRWQVESVQQYGGELKLEEPPVPEAVQKCLSPLYQGGDAAKAVQQLMQKVVTPVTAGGEELTTFLAWTEANGYLQTPSREGESYIPVANHLVHMISRHVDLARPQTQQELAKIILTDFCSSLWTTGVMGRYGVRKRQYDQSGQPTIVDTFTFKERPNSYDRSSRNIMYAAKLLGQKLFTQEMAQAVSCLWEKPNLVLFSKNRLALSTFAANALAMVDENQNQNH